MRFYGLVKLKPDEWYNEVVKSCKERKTNYTTSIEISGNLRCNIGQVNYHLTKLANQGKLKRVYARWWVEYYLV